MRNSKLILASSSPRRRELLGKLGLKFTCIRPTIKEVRRRGEAPEELVKRFSFEKAMQVFSGLKSRQKDAVVIGSDTVVVIDGRILGKPKDGKDAAAMLRRLSGREHLVLSGFAVVSTEKVHISYTETKVVFRTLDRGLVSWYVDSGEPMDKAGAYAIQGLGMSLVAGIDGSYTNVVGLPVAEVFSVLRDEFGIVAL